LHGNTSSGRTILTDLLPGESALDGNKEHSGFYRDLEHEHFSTYTIDGNALVNEDQG